VPPTKSRNYAVQNRALVPLPAGSTAPMRPNPWCPGGVDLIPFEASFQNIWAPKYSPPLITARGIFRYACSLMFHPAPGF